MSSLNRSAANVEAQQTHAISLDCTSACVLLLFDPVLSNPLAAAARLSAVPMLNAWPPSKQQRWGCRSDTLQKSSVARPIRSSWYSWNFAAWAASGTRGCWAAWTSRSNEQAKVFLCGARCVIWAEADDAIYMPLPG